MIGDTSAGRANGARTRASDRGDNVDGRFRRRRRRRRLGFNPVPLVITLIVVGTVALGVLLLIGLMLPALGRAREQGNRIKCASNLRAIAQHAFIYSNSDVRSGGKFPRLYYDPAAAETGRPAAYTGAAGRQSFGPDGPPAGGPRANDVTGALFLLLKNPTQAPPEAFVCPSDDATPLATSPSAAANFPGRANLSYSYNNPYPTTAAVAGGWRFDNSLGPDYPLASDINPGDSPAGSPAKVAYTAGRAAMAPANSPNHWFEGQQVAYCDVHVEWQTTPFAGLQRGGVAYRDNIFAAQQNVSAGGTGGVVRAAAVDSADAVLLPTAADGPTPPFAARVVGQQPPGGASPVPLLAGGAALLAAVVGMVCWLAFRKRPPGPAQPYPGQPYPGQPYPGQPYPGQAYPGGPMPPYPPAGGYPRPPANAPGPPLPPPPLPPPPMPPPPRPPQ